MKVLLYEPDTAGHHGIVLSYVESVLKEGNIDFRLHVHREVGDEYMALQNLARKEHADLIHVLFIDGRARQWLLRPPYVSHKGIPVIANYYLYNNLNRPLRQWFWWWLLRRGLVSKLLISDNYSSERKYLPQIKKCIRYVPDPWRAADFPYFTLNNARLQLNLPIERRILLLFGDISHRKGADALLDAFLEIAQPNIDLLLLAGVVAQDLNQSEFRKQLQLGITAGTVRIDEGYISESDVSKYFFACDAVACVYPAWFKVSSGTFTRACAAGRPVLAAMSSVTGRLVADLQLGCVYTARDEAALRTGVRSILASAKSLREDAGFRQRASQIATEREFAAYSKALLTVYREMAPASESLVIEK